MEKSLLFHFRRIGVEFIIFSVYAVFSISWAATGSLMPLISITFVILSFNLWVVSWSVDKTHSFTLGFVYIFALIFISAILAQFVLPRRENFIQGEK
ncbi:hypothetical protein E8P28_07560 [Campylobacter jejuni]|nr:hypothetical protein [Campylobacter jejuni]EBF5458397.1 hypothetical protein [Campylobacter jejuni]